MLLNLKNLPLIHKFQPGSSVEISHNWLGFEFFNSFKISIFGVGVHKVLRTTRQIRPTKTSRRPVSNFEKKNIIS